MIDFGITEEQQMMADAAKSFAVNELEPLARDCDEEFKLPEDLLAKAWEMGFVSAAIPEAQGGAGFERSPTTNALILEELGAGCPALASACMASSLFVNPLIDFGTEEQKNTYLPDFAGTEFKAGTMAIHDNTLGFDPAAMKTVAVKDGSDYKLTGVKRLVPLADRSDNLLVLASTGEGLENVQAFIVPRDAEGLSISNEAERTLGFQAVPQFKITLDGVKVSGGQKLGGEDGIDAGKLLASIRIGAAALAVGCSRAVVDFSIPYAKERQAFGSAIGQKQGVAFMLADMHTEVDCMRWMTWKAASLLEQGDAGALKAAVLMQNYVQRKAMKVADDGIQVFGGHGFIRELPLEMWFRHTRTLTIVEGTAAA